jgi:uncharacterized tellurite resistance protein B-like protein
MVGAMMADGTASEAELAALHQQLATHELFEAMTGPASKMLIQVATDAVDFAGDSAGRVNAIAKGLPSRPLRLAAFAMACDVSCAEGGVGPEEKHYLDALRDAMWVSAQDADHLMSAASGGRTLAMLEKKVNQLMDIVPTLVELFMIREMTEGIVTEADKTEVRRLLVGLTDVGIRTSELDAAVNKAFANAQTRGLNLPHEIEGVGEELPDAIDRYWATVYTVVTDLARGTQGWRESAFFSALVDGLGLDPAAVESAVTDAELMVAAAGA